MSDDVFPIASIPGLDPKIIRIPIYSTGVQRHPTAKEWRVKWWLSPRYRYEMTFNFMRKSPSDEAKLLTDFVTAHRGKLDNFLLDDPYDSVQRRVRFDSDDVEIERIFDGVWKATITMISVVGES
jgi:hypothetical protein